MKIYAPVKNSNGVWASVQFVNGVGETDNQSLIDWFVNHGYKVETTTYNLINEVETTVDSDNKPDFESMTPNDLRDWMKEHGLGNKLKNIRSKDKLINIILEEGV